MKTTKEIQNEIFIIGATRRLEELNKERDYLIQIIKRNSSVPELNIDKPVSKNSHERVKRVHWTQTPAGKEKMRKRMKAMWKKKRQNG